MDKTEAFPILMLGTEKIDITPQYPVHLAGFSSRLGFSSGISQEIYAKVWYFRCFSSGIVFSDAVLIQGDLIWWGNTITNNMISELSLRYGIAPGAIIFHAEHNHSAPQTCEELSPLLGIYDDNYAEELCSEIIEGVGKARNNLEAVSIERGTGECHIGINRRKLVGGVAQMLPNEEGPTDPEVAVIRFRTNAKKIKGVLFHYTCHASTTDSCKISSEFGGTAARLIEKNIGENATASFLQGFCGDIRPELIHDGRFYRGDERDVLRLGKTLSDVVVDVLCKPMVAVKPTKLVSVQKTILLPFEKMPTESELKTANFGGSVDKNEWKTLMLKHPERIRPNWPLKVVLLQLSDHLSFLGMNAEMAVNYGLFIKKISHGDVIPLGYCNGILGYVPTAVQLKEGGYEAWDSVYYFCLPSRFSPQIEQDIDEGCQEVIRQAQKLSAVL